jgi:multiple sugar transport system ATP-binding protein
MSALVSQPLHTLDSTPAAPPAAGSSRIGGKSSTVAIACNRLVKRYGDVEVVHDFQFEVEENEFVVFLGPSGCGKSTILRMIAGLEEISGGELVIGGKVVTDLPPRDRGIAMVFQNYALYPHMSVYDNIAFGLRRLKVAKPEIQRRVGEVAATLGLDPYLQRKPTELSGGQQQRVAIARAMIKTPKVFLFDEPLSNLDAKLRNHMRIEIAKLHQALKTTTVYVTHDQHEAMTLADRIVLLREGRIEQVGTPREIFERPLTRYVAGFIGTPPMNLLDMSVRQSADGFELFGDCGALSIGSDRFDLASRERVTLGVRPAHLELLPEASGHSAFSGVVDLVEYLGNEALVTFSRAGVEIGAIVSSDRCPQVGQRVGSLVQEHNLHLFDFASGKSLAR